MDLKDYKLIAKSDLYQSTYQIRAVDLADASKKSKVKFAKAYGVFGDNVKISLDPEDLRNHIHEILSKLHDA